jgi:hypothetical protein
VSYTVTVTENATGEVREVVMEGTWEANRRFWWTSGNGACDCNRHLAFHGWPDSYEDEEEGEGEYDIPCGHERYSVALVPPPIEDQ